MVRGTLPELHGPDLGDSTPGSGMDQCKGPEARKSLMCLRNGQKIREAKGRSGIKYGWRGGKVRPSLWNLEALVSLSDVIQMKWDLTGRFQGFSV